MSAVDDAIERAETLRLALDTLPEHQLHTTARDTVVLAAEVKRHREEKRSLIRQLTEAEAERDQWHREVRRLRELLYGPNLLGPDLGAIE